MLRIYPAELSCVGGVYARVRCRESWPSLQICSQLDGSRTWHVTHDAARCVFVNIGVNCVTLSFAFSKIGKMRLNRKQLKKTILKFFTPNRLHF